MLKPLLAAILLGAPVSPARAGALNASQPGRGTPGASPLARVSAEQPLSSPLGVDLAPVSLDARLSVGALADAPASLPAEAPPALDVAAESAPRMPALEEPARARPSDERPPAPADPRAFPARAALEHAGEELEKAGSDPTPGAGQSDVLRKTFDLDAGAGAPKDPADQSVHVSGDDPRGIFSAAFSADGSLLATGDYEGFIRVWDVHSGREVALLGKPGKKHDAVFALAFDPRGTRLAAGRDDGSLELWDLAAKPPSPSTLRPPHPYQKDRNDTLTEIAFSPDGSLVASAGEDGTLELRQTNGAVLKRLQLNEPDDALSFSADGRYLAAVGRDDTAFLTPVSGEYVLAFRPEPTSAEAAISKGKLEDAVYATAFSPDGAQLAVSGPEGRRVHIWDVASRRVARELAVPEPTDWIGQAAFDPSGRLFAAADESGRVHVWDAHTGALLLSRRVPDSILALRFAPGALLVADRDGGIHRLRVP
ncbi:MAG TPA: hypothetical protein VNI01_08320 [Elusimicrobiota bacterium]|nr:hypothetical protein [Elusimicrobiota bacterium]